MIFLQNQPNFLNLKLILAREQMTSIEMYFFSQGDWRNFVLKWSSLEMLWL